MPWDDDLTPEKRAIIADDARIKVVRAGPGRGKTTLFVAAIQQALETWPDTKRGIAALSYTNIAQQEIEKKAGQIAAPHLIATIDAFVLRFIIRPFASIVAGHPDGLRLLPAPVAQYYDTDIQIGATNRDRAKLTEITFLQHDDQGSIVLHAKTAYGTSPIRDQRRQAVLTEKRNFWRRGLVTHSDTHYLAYEILHHPVHGDAITQLITRRFPVVLVDEYQDTNYFLARTLQKLLAQPNVRGLVVGDTDQAIFEFGGAHPRLFDDIAALDGARTFPLRTTHRCPRRVTTIAAHLATDPIQPTDSDGVVQLIPHQNNPQTLYDAIIQHRLATDRIAILSRRSNTIEQLQGQTRNNFPGRSALGTRLMDAADTLHRNPQKARQIVSAELGDLLLNERHHHHATLERHSIASNQWRQAIWHVLHTAATTVPDETWAAWAARVRPALRKAATIVNRPLDDAIINRRLQNNAEMNQPRPGRPPAPPVAWHSGTRLDTVHGVKGEEFEIVALYCPQPANRGQQRCISTQWWDVNQGEERRVAYVATTRAKRVFLLCVHQTTYDALRTQRPNFFQSFQPPNII